MAGNNNNNQDQVLIISQLFPPESMAGAHRWEKLANNLPNDISCRVLCPYPSVPVGTFDRRYSPWEAETIQGIPVTRLWTYQPKEDRSEFERILNYMFFSLFSTIYVILNFWRYDTVVTKIGPDTTLIPGMFAKFLGKNWVIDSDDLWLDNAADLGFVSKNSIIYNIISYLEEQSFSMCDHVITITPTMSDHYNSQYKVSQEDITVVPYGVDNSVFQPSAEQNPKERIIYTGKFGEAQAFIPFMKSFKKLCGINSNISLLMVGFGERKEELEMLCEKMGINDRVNIKGPVDREKIPNLLSNSILSWVPIKTNHQLDYARPTKLLETMAVGTPYVASNTREIKTVSEKSRSGFAVKNEPERIAEAMEIIISDAQKRKEMSLAGTEFIEKNHQWNALGEQVGAVLRQVRQDN